MLSDVMFYKQHLSVGLWLKSDWHGLCRSLRGTCPASLMSIRNRRRHQNRKRRSYRSLRSCQSGPLSTTTRKRPLQIRSASASPYTGPLLGLLILSSISSSWTVLHRMSVPSISSVQCSCIFPESSEWRCGILKGEQ